MDIGNPKTDICTLLAELGGGEVEKILNVALSHTCRNVVDNGGKGKVVLHLEVSRIGDSAQVNIGAKVEFKMPTMKGSRGEDYRVETPAFVSGTQGIVTIAPVDQLRLFGNGKSDPTNTRDFAG